MMFLRRAAKLFGGNRSDEPSGIETTTAPASAAETICSLLAAEQEIKSVVGAFKGGRLVSSGAAGWLTYGPYLTLEKGRYRVDIDGEGTIADGGICLVEVTVDLGKHVVAQIEASTSSRGLVRNLIFTLDVPCQDLEIRTHVDAHSTVAIDRVSVTKLVSTEDNSQRCKRVIFDNEETIAELTSVGSNTIIVTFQPFDYVGFERSGFGEDYFSSLGLDVLCFKPKRNIWYQDITTGMIEHYCRPLLKGYSRRISYGSSMGAYAALYFAKAFDVDKVIAISPQYSPRPADTSFEDRWHDVRHRMGYSHRWREPVRQHAYFIYDSRMASDRRHVECLKFVFPNHDDIALPFSGHPSATALFECRRLSTLIRDLIEDVPISVRQLRADIRNGSQHYARSLLLASAERHGSWTIGLFRHFVHVHRFDKRWIQLISSQLSAKLIAVGRQWEASELEATTMEADL